MSDKSCKYPKCKNTPIDPCEKCKGTFCSTHFTNHQCKKDPSDEEDEEQNKGLQKSQSSIHTQQEPIDLASEEEDIEKTNPVIEPTSNPENPPKISPSGMPTDFKKISIEIVNESHEKEHEIPHQSSSASSNFPVNRQMNIQSMQIPSDKSTTLKQNPVERTSIMQPHNPETTPSSQNEAKKSCFQLCCPCFS